MPRVSAASLAAAIPREAQARAPVLEEKGFIEGHDRDLGAEVLLYRVEAIDEFLAGESDGFAGLAGSRRAANAMYVGLGVLGYVVVDHQLEGFYIEAARRYVGRDEDAYLPGLEPLDDLGALRLGQVAHDELAVEPIDL